MAGVKDITNKRFGRLVVISLTNKRIQRSSVWLCRCDCGNLKEVPSSKLKAGSTKSCGCLRKGIKSYTRSRNIAQQRFGRLIAVEPTNARTHNRGIIWKCLCDCGNYSEASVHSLVNGFTHSCGCLKRESVAARSSKSITGERFGRLIVIEATKYRNKDNRDVIWKCLCDCGKTIKIRTGSLRSGNTRSCGCITCKNSVYLYALQADFTGLIKIGISGNVQKRIVSLQEELGERLNLLAYRTSSISEETDIHRSLSVWKAKHPNQPRGREWFYPSEEVMSVVEGIRC